MAPGDTTVGSTLFTRVGIWSGRGGLDAVQAGTVGSGQVDVAFAVPGEHCGKGLYRETYEISSELPQEAYVRITAAFNADTRRRTCATCVALHPTIDLAPYRWASLAQKARAWLPETMLLPAIDADAPGVTDDKPESVAVLGRERHSPRANS